MIEIFDVNGAKGLMNDDDFSCPFNFRSSTLRGVFLNPGTYWLVVDGFGGATGQFQITISPSP
jgi:hypothetical protein